MTSAWLALFVCACSVDPAGHRLACGEDGSCPAGRTCHRPRELERGICILAETSGDACVERPEQCNGLDDDCDGEIDEGFEGIAEACNGLDDDCDGAIDEGFADIPEACNGLDDDCDGALDEDFDLTVPERCGGCDVTCAPPNAMCLPDGRGSHACGSECDRARFTDCAPDLCVDTARDRRHCGGCGVACDDGEDCVAGTCRCGGTPDGEDCAGTVASTCCGSRCANLTTDAVHCGACRESCALRGDGTRVECEEGACLCNDCRAPSRCTLGICL
ncbi:MAG: hypothetical protein KF729_22535 [Sandaracinaceae bacterium]|nr:hypothetical protein [Sandaracinaceae bacterium]